jgi:hypothetical protein
MKRVVSEPCSVAGSNEDPNDVASRQELSTTPATKTPSIACQQRPRVRRDAQGLVAFNVSTPACCLAYRLGNGVKLPM